MTDFDPEKITFFARTDARGQDVSFGIKARDRQRHMYVVGKTGMGKSTLLENMAAQDIQNGEGMAFIDPHGSAAETLLEYVPEHRVKDVVYFAPFDLDHPVSFNVMEDVGPDKRHLVVSGLMSTFKKIWVDAWSARMEYILTNALLALIEYPDTTLLSVSRLFTDKPYRKKVVDYIKDPAVKSFWVDEFANYTDRFAAEALPAIQNKIGQFTGNPLIRNIIGQPHSSFDIRKLMDEKKILIMNLSKGLIGETNANLLGSMLTTRIYLAAMSRADLPVEQMRQMPNFYFYVDEFQSFANATFANILSEARKYHLNLIIAHQYIEQMEEDVRSAVFGNVGTTVAFRVGPFDAEVLETVFSPRFEATDLVNLGFAQIYLTLMIDGIGSQPFSAKTLPPVQLPPTSCREMVIDQSRKHYANRREEVEKMVIELCTPDRTEEPKKSKNNDWRSGGGNNNGKKPGGPDRYSNGAAPRKFNNGGGQSDRPTRPAPTQKTPEDLRNVLSKMTAATEVKPQTKPVASAAAPKVDPVEPKPKPQPVTAAAPSSPATNERKAAGDSSPVRKFDKAVETNDRPPRPAKPAPTQKTPEDLRNILAKMTTPATEKTKPAANSVPVSVEPDKPKEVTKEPSTRPDKIAKTNENGQDRGIKTNQTEETATKVKQAAPRPKQQTETSRGSTKFKSESNGKSALADALKQVELRPVKRQADAKPGPNPNETEVVKPPRPMITAQRAVTQSQAPAAAQIRKVVVEHRRQPQFPRPATRSIKVSRPAVEKVKLNRPATTVSATDNVRGQLGPDIAEIKRLLRQSDKDRSPFT